MQRWYFSIAIEFLYYDGIFGLIVFLHGNSILELG